MTPEDLENKTSNEKIKPCHDMGSWQKRVVDGRENVHRWAWTRSCLLNNIKCKTQPLTIESVGIYLDKDKKKAGRDINT